jgi:3-hydroxyacyl-[acyl-carrier-protein] dehydratase
MLLDNFFSLKEIQHIDHSINATVAFDESHSIFKGHFEDFPVVPGVCMMQIIKEIMEKELKKSFRVSKAAQMKFLSIINPNENREVSANIEYVSNDHTFDVEAKLFLGEIVFFKIKAVLVNGQ